MDNTNDEALGPLRALEVALDAIIRVTTSRIRLSKNDPRTDEFVAIEDKTDENILEILEESISDVFPIPENESTSCTESRIFQAQESSNSSLRTHGQSAAAILPGSSSNPSETSTRTGSFYSIPSCTSNFDGTIDPESLKNAEEAIADLEVNGPAGLVHLSSLSAEIGKPIRVWSSNNENSRKVGRTRTGQAVDVEYHEAVEADAPGHWTLRGNVEPRDTVGELNDCLFCVVAEQTGNLAPELRQKTVARMRKNIGSLAKRIEAISKDEKCDRISLLIGGARYSGQRPQDAKAVIDKSQKGHCHPNGLQGHPRGHASHPGATGETESAENYSRTGWKSAFLSREDQDAVGHLVLETQQAQQAMNDLNRGSNSVAVRLSPGQLAPGPLPEGLIFDNGQQQGGPCPIRELIIVLRHHQGQKDNADADVFVHTFYPRLN